MLNKCILSTSIKAGIAANTTQQELPEIEIDERHFALNPFGVPANANYIDFSHKSNSTDEKLWFIDVGPGYQKLISLLS